MEGRLSLLVAVLMVFAAPGTADFLVTYTELNITAAGCGVTKVCVEFPDDCDPAENQTCLFMSGIATSGDNLTIELSGQSSGYIALGLVMNASEDSTIGFICGQNSFDNDTFFFSTVERNDTDGVITPTNMTVTEIQGSVEGDMIQCEFTFPTTTTNFSVLLGNGTIDMDGVGPFTVILISGPLDFANPASNPDTTPAPSTATTKGGSCVLQPHALLLLLSILTLSVLQKA
ncbi:putative ferric-chelate reductase 1 [Anabas testudineus]|uniref:putative ferric-chelate reductase 1 n=1 Tax=Anabas testudineus TaxID=64144 RepID=UPI000E458F4F|nr:putative ferric-chelate reductase 1 [Anabas testudineus]